MAHPEPPTEGFTAEIEADLIQFRNETARQLGAGTGAMFGAGLDNETLSAFTNRFIIEAIESKLSRDEATDKDRVDRHLAYLHLHVAGQEANARLQAAMTAARTVIRGHSLSPTPSPSASPASSDTPRYLEAPEVNGISLAARALLNQTFIELGGRVYNQGYDIPKEERQILIAQFVLIRNGQVDIDGHVTHYNGDNFDFGIQGYQAIQAISAMDRTDAYMAAKIRRAVDIAKSHMAAIEDEYADQDALRRLDDEAYDIAVAMRTMEGISMTQAVEDQLQRAKKNKYQKAAEGSLTAADGAKVRAARRGVFLQTILDLTEGPVESLSVEDSEDGRDMDA